ncbi:molybdopterin-binding protein [Peptoniphilus equinus]|uniref:Molybdopterin molybdenumtransferase n=1 Tax=Peptoniphilus equinus TaxID=3016343 RepID=A0ABY7QTL0_9FIRM|nr:molybdopterin-binding protein [Peptoniphilus equinus]WBW50067.1 molybdopterin-binding protein [Peptoniphilus equinus]
MKKVKIEEAVGEVLCHDLTGITDSGFKGVRFSRGHVIAPEDLDVLRDMGKNHIYIWEPGVEEVHEEDAARAVVEVIGSDTLIYEGPKEGKFTIKAACDGLFVVDAKAVQAINSVGDYTLVTVADKKAVKAGETVAGLRIIPLVTLKANVAQAVELARASSPVLHVKPFMAKVTRLLITGEEIYSGRIQDRFEGVLRPKLRNYGAEVDKVVYCPDDRAFIEAQIHRAVEDGVALILLTGGMSVDPDDVTMDAIEGVSTVLITKGVPMQPGNMLTLARYDHTILVGVPGASMHAPFTSLDVVLPRIFADDPITSEEIATWGVGGLL